MLTSENSEAYDGDVYITMTGLDGTSEEIKLLHPGAGGAAAAAGADGVTAAAPVTSALFSSSAPSDFTIKAGGVGALSSLSVRMDATGSVTWWQLAQVIITNPATGEVGYFRYNCWLNSSWNQTAVLPAQSMFEYELAVHVSEKDAGEGELSVMVTGGYSTDWIVVPKNEGFSKYTNKAPATVTIKLTDLSKKPWSEGRVPQCCFLLH